VPFQGLPEFLSPSEAPLEHLRPGPSLAWQGVVPQGTGRGLVRAPSLG
jgi:hypothetical protein